MGSAPAPGTVTRKCTCTQPGAACPVGLRWESAPRVLSGSRACTSREERSRPRRCWPSLRESQRPQGQAGSGEAARPRLPCRFPGALLFFGPFWKQRPSRTTTDPAADRTPLKVSDARLLRLPAGRLGWPRACCSWVPKARVGSRSCCADGLEGSPGCEPLGESRGGSVSSRNGPAFPSVCFWRAQPPCSRRQRLLMGGRRAKVRVCFLV